jgi:hypothetical protein
MSIVQTVLTVVGDHPLPSFAVLLAAILYVRLMMSGPSTS